MVVILFVLRQFATTAPFVSPNHSLGMTIKLKPKKQLPSGHMGNLKSKGFKHLSECYPLDNRGLESTEVQGIFAREFLSSQDKYFSKAANHWSRFILFL